MNKLLMEFLGYISDEHMPFESQLVQEVSAAVKEVRNDEKKGVEYMTFQQKLLDEKNLSFLEGRSEGEAIGLQKGRSEGRSEGHSEGENRLSALIQKMLENNLMADIPRVTADPEFRNAMYERYHL